MPVGYDDGVNWRLGNRGCALVRGRRAPIVGRVSMDYTTLDVTDIPGVETGDRVTLLGRDGEATLGVEEIAEHIGTIPYEVLCSIGKRVERTFVARSLPPGTHTEPWSQRPVTRGTPEPPAPLPATTTRARRSRVLP